METRTSADKPLRVVSSGGTPGDCYRLLRDQSPPPSRPLPDRVNGPMDRDLVLVSDWVRALTRSKKTRESQRVASAKTRARRELCRRENFISHVEKITGVRARRDERSRAEINPIAN